VVSNFIVQALRGEPITVYGSGRQTRSFCYVDDLVDAFLRHMRAPGPLPGPINLGNPHEFTVGELATMVAGLTQSGSTVVYRPLPSDDPKQRRPDIRLAQEKLGWQPSVQLREGLGRTIAYFEQLLAVPVD
jgi:UDP-glucuronate decarboxylase